MANLDSRDKRFSMLLDDPFMPNPDGGFASVGDRLDVLGLYRGVEAAEPTPGGTGSTSAAARWYLARRKLRKAG